MESHPLTDGYAEINVGDERDGKSKNTKEDFGRDGGSCRYRTEALSVSVVTCDAATNRVGME